MEKVVGAIVILVITSNCGALGQIFPFSPNNNPSGWKHNIGHFAPQWGKVTPLLGSNTSLQCATIWSKHGNTININRNEDRAVSWMHNFIPGAVRIHSNRSALIMLDNTGQIDVVYNSVMAQEKCWYRPLSHVYCESCLNKVPNQDHDASSCAILYDSPFCSGFLGGRMEVDRWTDESHMQIEISRKVSSIIVRDGCELEIYNQENYWGNGAYVTGTIDWLPSEWDNRIASYKCRCSGDGDSGPTTTTPATISTERPDVQRLLFEVSGRNLPDTDTGFGTIDAYFELYETTDDGRNQAVLLRSSTVSDQENPQWGNVIDYNFDRSKNQWLKFKVYDEDRIRGDDTVGRVWISVADFVDKSQVTYARLDESDGYLVMQSVGPPVPIHRNTPIGQLPMPFRTPDTKTLTFRVSAQGISKKDDVGFISVNSDPYVIITIIDGINGNERPVGRSATIRSTSNPSWGDTFQVDWDRRKNQRLHIVIYDEDTLRTDDKIGSAWIELNDYVAKNEVYKLVLPKKGTLTIAKTTSEIIPPGKLRFKISGRNLPDTDTGFGTIDAYFELYETTEDGKNQAMLLRSSTISDQENPDWGNVVEYDFNRAKNQWLKFKVFDEDRARGDDTVGRVWINVADFVDKSQITYARLDEGDGYLVMQSVGPPVPIHRNTPIGQLPMPFGTPDTKTLTFRVSAQGISKKDDIGFIPGDSDPYVIITIIDGINGNDRPVGRSATIRSTSNPSWGDDFQVDWDRRKNQRLHIEIYDDDSLRTDDKIGSAWIELNDYVAKNEFYTLLLPKKGTLTIAKTTSVILPPGKLRFKVSGRNLPDTDTGFGTIDAYFELYESTGDGSNQSMILRSSTISDQENPDWGNVVEYDFDRARNQWLRFKVYDEDRARGDDTVGRVWINVADFVDKSQVTEARLDEGDGYLVMQSIAPLLPIHRNTPIGQLPMPFGTQDTKTLSFRVSAQGLSTKDDVGFISVNSDPYVIITIIDGINGKERQVGRSTTIPSTSNPSWVDTFQVDWDRRKNQRLHIQIYDEDTLRTDDKIGSVWVELNDYVAKDEFYTLLLPKKGTLTLAKTTAEVPPPGKLRFKVSGRNLPDTDTGFGTIDAYFELHETTDDGRNQSMILRSSTVSDEENPDWGNVVEYDFNRAKNQWLKFRVYDEDHARGDDSVGRVWINVADFVEKSQLTEARLDKGDGYLVIQSVGPPVPIHRNTPIGQLPMPFGTPDTKTLAFRVSAQGIPTKDDVGFISGNSDPYVIITMIDGINGKERNVGRSMTIRSTSNPSWGDTFQVDWDRRKNQRLHIVIYDDDTLRSDDKIGSAWIELNDYVAKNELYTLVLPKQGTLTLTKSEVIPPEKLKFKVSGRNFPDTDTGFGTVDAYFELYESTEDGKNQSMLLRSSTVSDQENPDWANVIEYDFERAKNQWLRFIVYDEDHLRGDDTVGRVWINVADFVEKSQMTEARLDKSDGYLIMQSIQPPVPKHRNTPVGQLPMPFGTPDTKTLAFRVSAQGVPTKDDVGFISGNSDPYVIITMIDGINGNERHVGRSMTMRSTSNPSWGDTFQVDWDRRKNQRLHIVIYDDDTLRTDDKIGSAWIELNDYVAKNELYTLLLPKKGTLTLTKSTAVVIPPEKLRFKVSGRNLPDTDTGFGTIDAYFELHESTEDGKNQSMLLRSPTVSDQENPDWGNVIEYDFEPAKNQWLRFKVLDEDRARGDDTVGRVWINVADFVEKSQLTEARLDESDGYLVLQSVQPPVPKHRNTPVGQLPMPFGTQDTKTLTFRVSAQGLSAKDDVGFISVNSDPYVIITIIDGINGKERDVGRSSTIPSTGNPSWGDDFHVNWDRRKNQRLHIEIYDDDTLRSDDKIGSAWIELNDYVAKNEFYTILLPKKGTLTLSKVQRK